MLIANDGFGEVTTRETAQAILDDDLADAVAVGRLFLANPDLPRRWQTGAELNEPDPDTFYGGGAEGYTDYPSLGELTRPRSAGRGASPERRPRWITGRAATVRSRPWVSRGPCTGSGSPSAGRTSP